MAEIFVGKVQELQENGRKIVQAGDTEVGVFFHRGNFYAYENKCRHQGGPVCEGTLIGKVEAILDEKKQYLGERFSEETIHLVCPWHGVEYDLTTGVCHPDPEVRLQSYPVVQRGDEVYVVV